MRRVGLSLALVFAISFAHCVISARALEPVIQAEAGSVGASIGSFYVREVTGPRPNAASCLVCKYGNRPVVIICCRKLDEIHRQLVLSLDKEIDSRRGLGLRGFSMFMTDVDGQTQPQLMQLVREHDVHLPLTIPVERQGPGTLGLNPDVETTVILYRQRKVEKRFEYAAGSLTSEDVEKLAAHVKDMIEPARSLQKGSSAEDILADRAAPPVESSSAAPSGN